jgi:hypothetical protein
MNHNSYFDSLLSHYFHQDNAAWRSIAWVIPLEAGVFAGAFAKPGLPGLLLVIIGTILIVALAVYTQKSFQDRDINLGLIDSVKPEGFLLTKKDTCVSGYSCLILGFWILMLSNAFLLALEMCEHFGWLKCLTIIFFPPSQRSF